eukprot:CAMPEP_0115632564 /NCGR_PEP_ID=MMETSP0272-20121206/31590_1 /TAXON_ID=71861 /ORGANISM="Scrippsiella trochoidea, Strain CCMP3099" /LENGTH=131 /DNA_ID=CAMNT_0003069285 /DNA_START=162 /DNA_END=557 /DNA_ORIENTATION=+
MSTCEQAPLADAAVAVEAGALRAVNNEFGEIGIVPLELSQEPVVVHIRNRVALRGADPPSIRVLPKLKPPLGAGTDHPVDIVVPTEQIAEATKLQDVGKRAIAICADGHAKFLRLVPKDACQSLRDDLIPV